MHIVKVVALLDIYSILYYSSYSAPFAALKGHVDSISHCPEIHQAAVNEFVNDEYRYLKLQICQLELEISLVNYHNLPA